MWIKSLNVVNICLSAGPQSNAASTSPVTLNQIIAAANEIPAESDSFKRVTLNSASSSHFQVLRSSLASANIANEALKVVEASKQLKKEYGFFKYFL